jgi:hypothetical protein
MQWNWRNWLELQNETKSNIKIFLGVDAFGSVKKYHETREFDNEEIYLHIQNLIWVKSVPCN